MEHESSNAYRTIFPPYFDLRIFAEIYASKINAKFILADSLLSFETIARKEIDNLGEINPMSFKINFKGEIQIPEKSEKFKVLKNESKKEIKNTIAKKQNVFIFSLRKGLASMTICRDCNQEVLCEECSAPLVLYLSRDSTKRMFICNRCKKEASTETKCKNCGSWNLMPLGIGTDTVFEEVKKEFPDINVFKLDKESAKTGKNAEKIIKEFEESKGSILIGTEMALFYLKEKLSLTVIASFDSLWSIPNYKINEKIIRLMTQIISKTEKKFIVQTKNEQDPAILAIKTENLLSFVREELKDRENIGYPPYKTFIKISYIGNKEETVKTKEFLKKFLKEYDPIIFSGFIAKQKGKYATNVLIKKNRNEWSLPELSSGSAIDQNLFEKLIFLSPTFLISIDPEDLL
jgi:primosomal protein N' (replication factor Y)